MKTMLGFASCAGTGAATSAAAVQRSPGSHNSLLTMYAPPDDQVIRNSCDSGRNFSPPRTRRSIATQNNSTETQRAPRTLKLFSLCPPCLPGEFLRLPDDPQSLPFQTNERRLLYALKTYGR